MAYNLEEQEQLDNIKSWWKQYGNIITWTLIIALAGYAAWTGWNTYQRNQAAQASQLYSELQKAMELKDNAKVQRIASDIESKFGSTAYAPMGALVAAKSAFDAKDLKTATDRLQWVIANADDKEYQAIAKIRLAGIRLDEKAYDEALKLVSGEFPPSFAGIAADRKGDILTAQSKLQEARSAYQLALEKTDANNPGRELIQVKLDALGGEQAKPAA